MKRLTIIAITLFFSSSLIAQNYENDSVKQTIVDFFDAFNNQDTIKLKVMAKGNINMQSISVNHEGKTRLDENDYSSFVKNIASIPNDKTFEEKILGFDIKIDGNMANAWTPYEFWFDGNFSHCGINSFQLIKEDKTWKIIYLVDTRRKKCLF